MGVRVRGRRGPIGLVLAASAWMALVGNMPLWLALHRLGLLGSAAGWAMAAALALVLGGCTAALLSLLAWRWMLKPAVTLLLFATGVSAYFMLAYHVVIDPGMLVNVVETDFREAAEYLSPWLLVHLALVVGLPVAAVWTAPVSIRPAASQLLRNLGAAAAALALAAVAILAVFQPLASAMRNHKELRYMMSPLNSLYASGVIASRPFMGRAGPVMRVGRDAVFERARTGKPPLLVLVLGETARSRNFGLNGYARDTTPELAGEGVASFTQHVVLRHQHGGVLALHVLAPGRQAFNARTQPQENLLDVLDHAGLAVLWIDNQAGCKGVCDRVADGHRAAASPDPALCADGECLDGILLQGLDAARRGAARRAPGAGRGGGAAPDGQPWAGLLAALASVVQALPARMHERQPAGVQPRAGGQQPTTTRSPTPTTYWLRSIRWLRQREDRWDSAMIYVSDHGESLGENNLYLHGLPYAIAPDVQKHVPWITWLSKGFESRSGVSLGCLRQRQDAHLSHDNYFHSVLGLLEVRTSAYSRRLDAYAECAPGPAQGGQPRRDSLAGAFGATAMH